MGELLDNTRKYVHSCCKPLLWGGGMLTSGNSSSEEEALSSACFSTCRSQDHIKGHTSFIPENCTSKSPWGGHKKKLLMRLRGWEGFEKGINAPPPTDMPKDGLYATNERRYHKQKNGRIGTF